LVGLSTNHQQMQKFGQFSRGARKLFYSIDTQPHLISPRIQTKSALERTKTRLTAVDLPKRNIKQEATWPTSTAILRSVPGSQYRLQQVADYVRGLNARQALMDLKKLNRRHAYYVYHLVRSAMFNGENHKNLNADRLVLKTIFVTKGKHHKRLKIHARGKTGIRTIKSSHIRVVLMEVPERENERKLGARGWNNDTWEKYYEKQSENQK
jgi:ribosomal protein L22